jgi:hypothetical protein
MSSDQIRFPNWMPSDAQRTCNDIVSIAQTADDPLPEARYVLERLATYLEMKKAWVELERFPNLHPANLLMMTFITWLCAVQNQILHKAPDYADSGKRELAAQARAVTNRMRAVDPTIRAEEGISDSTLAELDRVAAFLEREARTYDALLKIAAPSRKVRLRNALEIAFVNAMCNSLWRPAGRRPYTLVAILANVVFDVREKQWDADRVKHCYRSRSGTKPPRARG